MSILALATTLLPLILRITDLIKAGVEITQVIQGDPGTDAETKAQIAEYNTRLDAALLAVQNARLPVA